MGRGCLRSEGWESRLNAVLDDARSKDFHVRQWNCARFAQACAEAVRGEAIPDAWHGSLEATADAVLPRVKPRMAQRGDVVLAHTPEPSLGVYVGGIRRQAAFVTASGLTFYPMRRVRIVWSV